MSSKNSYNTGDIVKLKSGGPSMTIHEVLFTEAITNAHLYDDGRPVEHSIEKEAEFNGHYSCQWFAGKKLDRGVFSEESLVAAVAD